jgi:hypothetical protein
VDGGNRAIWGWWPMTVVLIQCFSFDSRGETTGQSVTERRSGGSELVLTQWEGNVMTLGRGDAAPGRGKEETKSADANLTEPKNKENIHSRFSWYKLTVKI